MNDLFHWLVDVATWRSPFRKRAFREFAKRLAPVLIASTDPAISTLGIALGATGDLFEKYERGSKKK